MPTVNVEENITQLRSTIEKMTQEVFRLQGMLPPLRDSRRVVLRQLTSPTILISPWRSPWRSSRASKRSPSNFQHSKHL